MFLYILDGMKHILCILVGRIHVFIHFRGKDKYYGHLSGKIHSFTHFSGKDTFSIRFSVNETYFTYLSGKDTCFYTF